MPRPGIRYRCIEPDSSTSKPPGSASWISTDNLPFHLALVSRRSWPCTALSDGQPAFDRGVGEHRAGDVADAGDRFGR